MKPIGKRYSKAEALSILAECRLLQESIDELTRKARESLKPRLRAIDGGKTDKETG